MHEYGRPPDWLDAPAAAVLRDLQGSQPIAEITVIASRAADLNGLQIGIAEGPEFSEPLPQLEDDLDPAEPTEHGGGLGGDWVPRTLTGPSLLVLIADILQEDLAETHATWAQSRPPCPHHPHPARPAIRDGEAWWVCERDDEPLYRIGRGEVPTELVIPPSWNAPKRSRRAEKRRQARRRTR